jgi:hypothetical protein
MRGWAQQFDMVQRTRSCRQVWSFVRQYANPLEVVNEFAKISVIWILSVASTEADNTRCSVSTFEVCV